MSGKRGARAPKSSVRDGLRERRRKGNEGIENGAVTERKEGVQTMAPLRDGQKLQDDTRVVLGTSEKRRNKSTKWVDGGTEMEAREAEISCVSRMAVVKKLNSVNGEMDKIEIIVA